jgi:alkaline phosphatase
MFLGDLGLENPRVFGQEKPAQPAKSAEKTEKAEVVRPAPEEVEIPEGLDTLAAKQHIAVQSRVCPWGFWGYRPESFSSWTNHSNRLIPVYVFGESLEPYVGARSLYRDEARVRELYGRVPENTVQPEAEYADQTDVYRLQRQSIESGNGSEVVKVWR